MRLAMLSLSGLSVGDAFGERFFVHPNLAERLIAERAVPRAPWTTTDDTEMALGIVEVLDNHGRIDQDALAVVFARRYEAAPNRGYGGTAHDILRDIGVGLPWRDVSSAVFGGQGSMGNGGAMRVAPIGAYFYDDLDAVDRESRSSAEVTHAHPEGQAGAVAVARVAAIATEIGLGKRPRDGKTMLEAALLGIHDVPTRRYLERALAIPLGEDTKKAAELLGTGQRVLAWDTVPFSLWCAARHLDDYETALWTTVSGLGDRDTTCAIVGGIVAMSAGEASIPQAFRDAREPLNLL
jgi:ADP-ribosylglycohydrolase